MPTLPKGTVEASEIWKRFRADDRPTYLQDQIAAVKDRVTQRHERELALGAFRRQLPGRARAVVGR